MRTLQSELIKKGFYKPHKKKHSSRIKKRSKNSSKTKSENLSRLDWEEIMGMRRPRYKRNRGAYRQVQ